MEREFGIWTFLPAISIRLETFLCMMAKHDVEFDIVNFTLKKGDSDSFWCIATPTSLGTGCAV